MTDSQKEVNADELAVLEWLTDHLLASFDLEAEIEYLKVKHELQSYSQMPKSQRPQPRSAGQEFSGIDSKPKYDGIQRFEMTGEEWQALAERVRKKWEKKRDEELAKKAKQVEQQENSYTTASVPVPTLPPGHVTWAEGPVPPRRDGPPDTNNSAIQKPASTPPASEPNTTKSSLQPATPESTGRSAPASPELRPRNPLFDGPIRWRHSDETRRERLYERAPNGEIRELDPQN